MSNNNEVNFLATLFFLASCSDKNQHDCKAIALYMSDRSANNNAKLDLNELLLAEGLQAQHGIRGQSSYSRGFETCMRAHHGSL